MKKSIFTAAMVAMFFTVNNASAQEVQEITVNDIVAELNINDAQAFLPMYQKMLSQIESVSRQENVNEDKKTAKIENIKEEYADKFSYVLDSEQNLAVLSTIPYDYIEKRTK